MKVLFVGDIFGNSGRKAVKEIVPLLKRERGIDFCIANAENSAAGSGITYVIATELYKSGIDFITMGNHTWSKKEIQNFIDSDQKIIRPANYAPGLPGRGSAVIDTPCGKIAVINLIGRVYMEPADCPFRTADAEIEKVKHITKTIFVDFHAEATSEKCALAWHLDGRVSAVVGTHTHVQTSDERILPCGTGFITDVGMTGPYEGIIGVERDIVIDKFIKGMPVKFDVASGEIQFNAVLIEFEEKKGRTVSIERINRKISIP